MGPQQMIEQWRPAAVDAHWPPSSSARPVAVSHHASSNVFPGPVSKPRTGWLEPFGGQQRHVGNTTDIHHRAWRIGLEHRCVERRTSGALPTSSHIAGFENRRRPRCPSAPPAAPGD